MIRELVPPDTGLAFEAMRALRPTLADERAFVARVDGIQRQEGYRLLGAFEAGAEQAAAVAGFRIAHSISWGRFLYVDDLCTVPTARRRGLATSLLHWLVHEGSRTGCEQLHLDSGVGAERSDAHRLYLGAGLQISAHHFARSLGREQR